MTGDRRCNANQCDWRATRDEDDAAAISPDAQLALHAIESGHPLCIVCYRSLTHAETQTCERCITEAQTNLSGIRTLYDELPRHLRTVGSTIYGGGPGASDGRPLPGGDALALLGPGSDGLDEDGSTTRDGDPVSVAYELAWWERDWRQTRNETYDDTTPRSSGRVVRAAVGYLERYTRWAAVSHHGFHEYARDIRNLHVRLEVATARVRRPAPVSTGCFFCRGQLVRKIAATGLEEETVTCRACGKTYDDKQLAMARAQEYLDASTWTDAAGVQWSTLQALVNQLERSENTIKRWRHDGSVASVIVGGVVFFHTAQAEAVNATRPKRNRAS